MSDDMSKPKNPYANNDYEVGKGKPPLHSRWQPGQCPNRKGRPKGTKNFDTDLDEELRERIPLTENGRRKMISKQRAFIKRMVSDAIQGDAKAGAMLQACILRKMAKEGDEGVSHLSPQDQDILDEFLRRNLPKPQKSGGQADE